MYNCGHVHVAVGYVLCGVQVCRMYTDIWGLHRVSKLQYTFSIYDLIPCTDYRMNCVCSFAILIENYKLSKEHVRLIDESVTEIRDEAFTVNIRNLRVLRINTKGR